MTGKIFWAAVLALLAVACSEPEAGHSLYSMNLRGRVKRVSVYSYEVNVRDGEVQEGEALNGEGMNEVSHFGENGLLRRNESCSGGDLIGWRDYFYNGDNRLQRVEHHSVLFNGDSTVEAEWESPKSYVLRTYDEQGAKVSEKVSSRSGNRLYQTIITPDDTVTLKIRYRNSRPVREERDSAGCRTTTKYDYDGKGNLARIATLCGGELTSCVKVEYDVFDGEGNWLRRILYDARGSGAETPSVIQKRTIVYY